MKTFLENPELLFGVIFLGIGLLGAAIPMLAFVMPDKANAATVKTARGHHPTDQEYIRIGIILAVITAVEVALFYVEFDRVLLIPTLVVLSAAKFAVVVAFFMHLKFDSSIFTTAFVAGMLLAFAVFTVVIATLGGNVI
jgi:cytochrome c oxidase subunit 4